MAPSGRRPKTKPDDLGCESACTANNINFDADDFTLSIFQSVHNLHPPSPFVITQPESWYSFYRPTQDSILPSHAFNSNGPTTSTCKWNINNLKNVTNKMCVKIAINARLKELIAWQLDLVGCYILIWFTRPQMVTHAGTNRVPYNSTQLNSTGDYGRRCLTPLCPHHY